MTETDPRLKEELLAAYGRGLPDEERFTESVMSTVEEEAGGEGEIGIRVPTRGRTWWLGALVAACVLGVVLILTDVDAPAPDPQLAGGLPESDFGKEFEPDLTVRIDEKGGILLGDDRIELSSVHGVLQRAVAELRPDTPGHPRVVISAAGAAPWSSVHAILTGLDEAKAYIPWVAVRSPRTGEVRYLAVPFPTDPARRRPQPPELRPAPAPVLLELQRSVEERTTRVCFRGEEIGRDEAGIERIRVAVEDHFPPEDRGAPGRRRVRVRAWASVPHRQVVSAIDRLISGGVSRLLFDVNVPAHLTVFVGLQAEGNRTILFLGEERTRYEMKEGLAALAEKIRGHQADGRTPHGFLSARTYIDQEAVRRVLALFEAEGVEDVVRLN
jgi:biopolymer transport protein ExbD